MLLKITDLEKRFGETTVLQGVSLDIDRGEAVALTGESGSGKSTLLHIAAGLESFDGGEVAIDGAALSGLDDTALAGLRRQRVGLVFQQFNLIPSLDVGANIAFQARLAGRHDAEWSRSLADRLGLTDQLGKYPDELSGGQQQRVAIGRAIAARPPLVLADEPTGNLDEATGDGVFELLLSLVRDSGAGLLIVTHSERLAGKADRRLHLRRGRILT